MSLALQGEEAEGDAVDGAAAGQEHEQPAHVAVAHRGGARQAAGLQRVSWRRDPQEAGRAAGGTPPAFVPMMQSGRYGLETLATKHMKSLSQDHKPGLNSGSNNPEVKGQPDKVVTLTTI